jgi:retron-type reverse transcriptase
LDGYSRKANPNASVTSDIAALDESQKHDRAAGGLMLAQEPEEIVDSVPEDLMLRAVRHHTDQQWVVLYVERWLKAPMQRLDGTLTPRVKGTPQGSPISPCPRQLVLALWA